MRVNVKMQVVKNGGSWDVAWKCLWTWH